MLQPTERITERQRGFFFRYSNKHHLITTNQYDSNLARSVSPSWSLNTEQVCQLKSGFHHQVEPKVELARTPPESRGKREEGEKNPYTMTKTEGTKRQITNTEKHQNLNRGTLMAGGHRKLEAKVCNQTNKCRTAMTVNRDGLAANKYMGLSLYSVKDCSVSLHH